MTAARIKDDANIRVASEDRSSLVLAVSGDLDAYSVSPLWNEFSRLLTGRDIESLSVDGSGIRYCDGAGAAFLLRIQQHASNAGAAFTFQNLTQSVNKVLGMYDTETILQPLTQKPPLPLLEDTGRRVLDVVSDLAAFITFVGEVIAVGIGSLKQASRIRWGDVRLVAERAGADGVPIILLVNFLIGVILAFQCAIPLKMFGADVFVGTIVAIAVVRELGPLMTAIMLAGRTGSAFAAEIGTMKVNEELDALDTMGLNRIQFLVLPRILAAVAVTPLLAVIANVSGLVGGAIVFRGMGYPLVMYWNQTRDAIGQADFFGGLFKAAIFGIIVATVGCLKGIETKTGASAVGQSTTSSVVTGIILIVLADGVLSTLFYYLGI